MSKPKQYKRESARNVAVCNVLMNTIKTEPTSWQTIVEAIKAEIVIGNWLTEVRGVLQWMINEKMVARTADIHVEEYVKL